MAKLSQGKSGPTGGVEPVTLLLPFLSGWSPVGSGLRAMEGTFVVSGPDLSWGWFRESPRVSRIIFNDFWWKKHIWGRSGVARREY